MIRGLAAALAAVALLAAAPAPAPLAAPPANAQTAVLRRYLDALRARRYGDAFALLEPGARAYFRSAANFASVFTTDGFALLAYTPAGARGDDRFRLYVVRERIRVMDPVHDRSGTATLDVALGVAGAGSAARIKDLGHPWRAVATAAEERTGNLRVRVKKVAFYAHAIALVVTFANLGDGYVTLLPYGRSVLRDADGDVYRLIASTDWHHTDRALFLGVRLAPSEQVTGVLSFGSPLLDDRARRFTLSVGPNLRDGADAPFVVDVAGITTPA